MLRLYDFALDDWREPTQADLDTYMALTRAYGRIRTAFKQGRPLEEEIEQAHAELMAEPSIAQTNAMPAPGPVWSCGHAHATRREAIDCLAER
jgi:hypothetical protein